MLKIFPINEDIQASAGMRLHKDIKKYIFSTDFVEPITATRVWPSRLAC